MKYGKKYFTGGIEHLQKSMKLSEARKKQTENKERGVWIKDLVALFVEQEGTILTDSS